MSRFKEAYEAVKAHGGYRAASRAVEIPESTLRSRVKRYLNPDRPEKLWVDQFPESMAVVASTLNQEKVPILTAGESLKRENMMLRGQLTTRQRQADGILRAVENVFYKTPINVAVFGPVDLREHDKAKPSHVPVMVLSDTQIGKASGSYSVQVARERIEILTEKQLRVLDIMRKGANIPYVEVWLGGDMVEGERIFPNQPYEIECGVGEQACIHAPSIMADYILAFASAGYRVKVRTTKGNHGRVASSRDPASDSANWDLVAYHVCMGITLDGNVPVAVRERIEWPDGISTHWYSIVEMPGGWNVMLTHGDMIAGGGTSASIEKKVSGWLNGAVPEKFDYVVMGHFHRGIEWPVGTCEVIVNGTTETPESPFLQGIVASTNRSFQRMLVFHEEHGLIDNKKFYLDNHVPRSKQ